MLNKILSKINFLKGTNDEIKLIFLYRHISLIATSFFYIISNYDTSLNNKLIVFLCLAVSAILLSYIYVKYRKDKNIVKALIIIEVIGNVLLLIPTGGLNSPYLWYSLNTVLVTAYYFKAIYCLGNIFVYLTLSMVVSYILFEDNKSSFRLVDEVLSNSNLILSFILITLAVQILVSLTKRLKKERKEISQVNYQLVEANKRAKKSLDHIMSLYQVVYSFINIKERSKLIKIILYYSKEITKADGAFFYLLSDENAQELEISEDISLDAKKSIYEELNNNINSIIKNTNIPSSIKIENREFTVMATKSEETVYGILGIMLNKQNKEGTSAETINQMKLLSSLISIALERIDLEEINRQFVISEEQNRIAREIHDSVCQHIFAINCMIHTLKQKCDKVTYEELKSEFDFISHSLNKANKELRATIYDLSKKCKETTSLKEELESHINELAKLNNIDISFEMKQNSKVYNEEIKRAILRIINESIGNAVRHGKGSQIKVMIYISYEMIEISIKDNGIGFDFDEVQMGLGIQNMNNIARYFNGEINIESKVGAGTTINILMQNNILKSAKGEVV